MTVITNAYKFDIDLSNKLWITMYQKVTAGLQEGKEFDFSPEHVRYFRKQVKQACNVYAWGLVCMTIPISAIEFKSLMKEHKSISLSKVIKNKDRIWNTFSGSNRVNKKETDLIILQLRLRSTMMGRWVIWSLEEMEMIALITHEDEYQVQYLDCTTNDDGLNMLKIICACVCPDTRVDTMIL